MNVISNAIPYIQILFRYILRESLVNCTEPAFVEQLFAQQLIFL